MLLSIYDLFRRELVINGLERCCNFVVQCLCVAFYSLCMLFRSGGRQRDSNSRKGSFERGEPIFGVDMKRSDYKPRLIVELKDLLDTSINVGRFLGLAGNNIDPARLLVYHS